MKTTGNDLQQKANEVKVLCMHREQKTLKDYDTSVKHKKKGRRHILRYFATIF